MRRHALRSAGVWILVLACCGGLAAGDTRTLHGRYEWSGDRGDLEAVFTPAGESKWNVDFHFTFSGERRVFSGTAEGSLSGGELHGSVTNEDRGRRFAFHLKFEDGRLRGTHAEVQRGRERPTGTLTLG